MATKSQGRASAKLERLKYIRVLMASCRWVAGISAETVAEHFGVSVKTVEHDAAEASRQIKLAIGSDEDLRNEIKANLQYLRREAVRTKKFGTAIEACRVMAGIVEKPKELNVNAGAFTLKDVADLQKSTGANKGQKK